MDTLRECALSGDWDEKMFVSCFRACNVLLPILAKGLNGIGFKRADVKAEATSVAASALKVLGMSQWEGKIWTVPDIHSDAVLVM